VKAEMKNLFYDSDFFSERRKLFPSNKFIWEHWWNFSKCCWFIWRIHFILNEKNWNCFAYFLKNDNCFYI
jgi:hypothetical protein